MLTVLPEVCLTGSVQYQRLWFCCLAQIPSHILGLRHALKETLSFFVWYSNISVFTITTVVRNSFLVWYKHQCSCSCKSPKGKSSPQCMLFVMAHSHAPYKDGKASCLHLLHWPLADDCDWAYYLKAASLLAFLISVMTRDSMTCVCTDSVLWELGLFVPEGQEGQRLFWERRQTTVHKVSWCKQKIIWWNRGKILSTASL